MIPPLKTANRCRNHQARQYLLVPAVAALAFHCTAAAQLVALVRMMVAVVIAAVELAVAGPAACCPTYASRGT